MPDDSRQTRNSTLEEAIQSLQFDMDRIVKPALKEITDTLKEGAYATPKDLAEIRLIAEKVDARTTNYPIVEKVVFGLVSMILLAVVGAIIALVVVKGH